MTIVGAVLARVNCPGCGTEVPVECGDVTGETLDTLIPEARTQAARACPAHDQAILVGSWETEPARSSVPLTQGQIRSLLRECVTVVKPGETLAIRAHEGWTPDQIGQVNEWITYWDLPFRAVMFPGAEFAVVTSTENE